MTVHCSLAHPPHPSGAGHHWTSLLTCRSISSRRCLLDCSLCSFSFNGWTTLATSEATASATSRWRDAVVNPVSELRMEPWPWLREALRCDTDIAVAVRAVPSRSSHMSRSNAVEILGKTGVLPLPTAFSAMGIKEGVDLA
eukprot:CAMPEP_0180592018 /NCGR_PEP_ID=MMETSP1037_2-20121125/19505_1 /TAXON_ID=632150 /ORGANISM="Azadinium spinosum, Strain 3D9" /LENGTH=140 /DNA_ID=CAMNT_0022610327 /DNA_START=15 /DNA_END=437 /DNA_ORIENTATION=+